MVRVLVDGVTSTRCNIRPLQSWECNASLKHHNQSCWWWRYLFPTNYSTVVLVFGLVLISMSLIIQKSSVLVLLIAYQLKSILGLVILSLFVINTHVGSSAHVDINKVIMELQGPYSFFNSISLCRVNRTKCKPEKKLGEFPLFMLVLVTTLHTYIKIHCYISRLIHM